MQWFSFKSNSTQRNFATFIIGNNDDFLPVLAKWILVVQMLSSARVGVDITVQTPNVV